MKHICLSAGATILVSSLVYGEVSFNGVFGTKGDYAGLELTRDKIVNNGKTVSGYGAPTSALVDAAHWSDGAAVTSEKDYVIAGAGGRIATTTGDAVFNGRSLTLGVSGGNAGYLVPVGASNLSIEGDGLVINKGGVVWNGSYGRSTAINGKLTVYTSKSSPATFWDHWSGAQTHNMNFTQLIGDSTTGIKFTGQSHTTSEYKNKLVFSGDWSAFYGLLTVATYYDKVSFLNVNCPGSFEYVAGNSLALCAGGDDYTGSFRFDAMTLSSIAAVTLGISATTNATLSADALTVTGTGKLPLSVLLGGIPKTEWPMDLISDPRKSVLIDLPATASSIFDTFDVAIEFPSSWSSNEKKYARYRSAVAVDMKEEVEGGRRRLVCKIPKYTYCTQSGSSFSGNLLRHPEYWAGVDPGAGFSPDTAYYVTGNSTIYLTQGDDMVFGGGPLCLTGGYVCTGGVMTFDDLRILSAVKIQYAASTESKHEFNGNITIFDRDLNGNSGGSVQFWSGQNLTMTVKSRLHGKGRILIDSPNWSADEKQKNRTVVFTGDNSDYAGKIAVANYADGYKSTLKITDGKSLGGALSEFTPKAVELLARSVLEVGATTVLEESTRGVYAAAGSTISVPNAADVFRVDSTLTCAGAVTKTGEGTLALVASAAAGSETPELLVSEGSLQVAGSDAVAGLGVRFAARTSLVYDLDSTGAGLSDTGLSVESGTLSSEDAKLRVVCKTAFDSAAVEKKELALFTGPAAAVEDLSNRINVRLVYSQGRSRRAKLSLVDAVSPGYKKIVASFEKSGTLIMVR